MVVAPDRMVVVEYGLYSVWFTFLYCRYRFDTAEGAGRSVTKVASASILNVTLEKINHGCTGEVNEKARFP